MGRRTPLYDAHRALGARVVEFAGWDMPVSYAGPADEHQAVRSACGLFDVSHMGEVEIQGPGAARFCQAVTVNDVERLGDGDGQYTLFCNAAGGVLDDLIVYRLEAERYLMIVNAANTAADLAWLEAQPRDGVRIVDRSDALALLALQGPEAERALRTQTALDLPSQRPFTIYRGTVAGLSVLVSRTGYTGEDGFELVVDAAEAPALWQALLAAVRTAGGQPAGLAARDTLRLEAGLPLCGSDMDATTTPLEAGLAWVVKLRKPAFVGKAALVAQAEAGVPRRLVGLQLGEPGIPRHGYPVWLGADRIGAVTSGTKSPTLGSFIGMAYVDARAARPGTGVAVEIRGRRLPAEVVARPFYRRMSHEEKHAGT